MTWQDLAVVCVVAWAGMLLAREAWRRWATTGRTGCPACKTCRSAKQERQPVTDKDGIDNPACGGEPCRLGPSEQPDS